MTDEELIAQYLEPNPNRLGGANWRVKERAVSVWALVGYWKTVGEDIEKVAAGYVVPPEAVAAALAYYNRHPELIDDKLATNAL
ncbi:MAG TPA: DUF433 domain-containing protein [Chloroflexota bacterium]|jgi:uncharacterized protein (DUF433 family)